MLNFMVAIKNAAPWFYPSAVNGKPPSVFYRFLLLSPKRNEAMCHHLMYHEELSTGLASSIWQFMNLRNIFVVLFAAQEFNFLEISIVSSSQSAFEKS